MVNTVYFIKDYLELERRRLQSATQRPNSVAHRHATASLFESFLWLHLGVELQYFDQELAENLLQSVYAPQLFASLRPKERQFEVHSSEFQSTPFEQRYNTEFFELAGLFPALQPLLIRCVDGSDVFNFFNTKVNASSTLRPIFQCLYAISLNMCADVLVQSFIAAVNFCNDAAWDKLESEKLSDKEIFFVESDSAEISVERGRAVVPGFLHLLEYMSKFKAMNEDMNDAASRGTFDRRSLMAIMDRIRMMQGWRTTVLSAMTTDRTRALANLLDKRYKDLLLNSGLTTNYFVTQFEELRNVWYMRMSAGA